MLKSIAVFLITVLMLTLFVACKSNESVQLLSDNSSEVQSSEVESSKVESSEVDSSESVSSNTVASVGSDYAEKDKQPTNNTTSTDKNINRPTVPSINITPSDKNSGSTSNPTPNGSQSSSNQTTTDKSPIDGLSLSEQYFWYENLTAQEQYNFMKTFPSVPDFVSWHNKVEAAYKAEHPEIELGKDSIVGNSK